MPELVAVLNAKQEEDYENKKFLAALQGVDIDKSARTSDAWEDLKARAYSGGKAKSGKDVMALQGANAKQKGFGIGMGLDAVTIGADGEVTKIG